MSRGKISWDAKEIGGKSGKCGENRGINWTKGRVGGYNLVGSDGSDHGWAYILILRGAEYT